MRPLFHAALTVELAKLAVASRCWNLYEVVEGRQPSLTKRVKKAKPVGSYLKPQKRFKGVDGDTLEMIQAQAERNYAQLEMLASLI